MSNYKVTSSFALFRNDEAVASCDSMVVCADLSAATRVFLSKIEELTDKATSAYNYDTLLASAYVEKILEHNNTMNVNKYVLELMPEDLQEEGTYEI